MAQASDSFSVLLISLREVAIGAIYLFMSHQLYHHLNGVEFCSAMFYNISWIFFSFVFVVGASLITIIVAVTAAAAVVVFFHLLSGDCSTAILNTLRLQLNSQNTTHLSLANSKKQQQQPTNQIKMDMRLLLFNWNFCCWSFFNFLLFVVETHVRLQTSCHAR